MPRRLRAPLRSRTDSTHTLPCSTGKQIIQLRNRSNNHEKYEESVNYESIFCSTRRSQWFFQSSKSPLISWERVSLCCFPGNNVERPRHHEIHNRMMITWCCHESVPCQKFCHTFRLTQVAGVLRFCCTVVVV